MAAVTRKRSIWAAIGNVVTERNSLIAIFIGVVLAIVGNEVSAGQTLSASWVWYLVTFFVVVIWVLLAAMKQLAAIEEIGLPPVRAVKDDGEGLERPTLLLDPSDLFGVGTRVSVFFQEAGSGYEVLVAHGVVRTIQQNKLVQVKVDGWLKGNEDVVREICNEKASALPSVIVRPSVTKETSADMAIRAVVNELMAQNITREHRSRPIWRDEVSGRFLDKEPERE